MRRTIIVHWEKKTKIFPTLRKEDGGGKGSIKLNRIERHIKASSKHHNTTEKGVGVITTFDNIYYIAQVVQRSPIRLSRTN